MKNNIKKFILFLLLLILGLGSLFGNEALVKERFPTSRVSPHNNDNWVEAEGATSIYYIDGERVLKVYDFESPKDKEKFETEVKAMLFAQKHALQNAQLFSYEQLSYEGKSYGIILMAKAKGKSLNSMLEDYSKSILTKGAKKAQIDLAIVALAQALSKMHQITEPYTSKTKSFPDRSMVRSFGKNLEKYELDHLSYQQVYDLYCQLKENFHPHFGLCHMDLHAGNIFYDFERDQIEFIDIETMQTYDTSYDVMYFLANLQAICRLYNIPAHITKEWTDLFITQYAKNQPIDKNNLLYQNFMTTIEMFYAYEAQPLISAWARAKFSSHFGKFS